MIALVPLDSLDATAVQARLADIIQRVGDDNPNLDLRFGPFRELLAYYFAVLAEQQGVNIQQYLNSRSLKDIEADPALADPDLVDAVLSNFRLTRQPGQVATGEVIVVVSADTTVTIGQGSVWGAQGQNFVTPTAFTAKTESGQIVLATDRLLEPTADGRFAFTITVQAVDTGTAGNIPRNSAVIPEVIPANYVQSYAASDFRLGVATETNAELLDRLQAGIAARTMSNRTNMMAMLRTIEAFSRIVGMSIIGYGDSEMLRDKHTIFPAAFGGRADWYIRTQATIQTVKLVKTATLIAIEEDLTGIWQFTITAQDTSTFYEVSAIRPEGVTDAEGGFTLVGDERSFVLAGEFPPDILTAEEAAFSPYATAAIQFQDTETATTGLTVGATKSYDVYVATMPLLADIQTAINARDVRSYGADCLVKAPVPCFTQVNLTVHKRSGDPDPDTDAMRTALAATINAVGFVGTLYASQLISVAQGYLLSGQTLSNIDMLGRIRHCDNSISYLRDSDVLEIPAEPERMTSARTAQFFADADTIAITVKTTIP